MSDQVKIILPKLGESIVSATVVQWFKKVGDRVSLDEPLLEVSTDKVNSEIPSPAAGILIEICAEPNQELEVGALLAVLSTQELVSSHTGTQAPAAAVAKQQQPVEQQDDFLTPAVLRLLKDKGISFQEIDRIPHTGQGGRLTKKDIEDYCASMTPAQQLKPCPLARSEPSVERVKMSGLRKAIAENMVRSFYQAPHASLITEIDVTKLVKYIKEHKESFLKKTGVKLTITSFVAQAMTKAVQAFPLINSSLEDDTIVMKRFVNLGVAVSVDQGVMVPVIRGCQNLKISEISRKIGECAEKARTHTLSPDDVKDGTITMTNFGMTGITIGIPIIRFPEVAIIGLGAITKQVKAMADDSLAIRSVMMVSLTFDHRVLDGLYGCGFLNELKKLLEEGAVFEE